MIPRVLALAGLVWLVYWNSLHNPFAFDDFSVIASNPAVRGPADVPSFFRDGSTFSIFKRNWDYRPLFLTSMALCWWIGGGSTLPFHLVSVSLHMANVLLVFLLVRLFLTQSRYGARSRSYSEGERAAFFAAALFAVHPLATQSVNYITQQSVPMMSFFYLLSFYLFVRVYGTDSSPAVQPSRKLGSYAACALSLLSKATAVTLPLNLLVWEVLFGTPRAQRPGKYKSRWISQVPRLYKLLPYFALTLAYYLLGRYIFQGSPPGRVTGIRQAFSGYLIQTKALVFCYLKLALFPFGLNIDRYFPASDSFFEPRVLISFLILAAILGLLIRFRKKRIAVFWTLWFPICLLVTTYLVSLPDLVNEHRVYLSLVGVSGLAGLLFLRVRMRLPAQLFSYRVGRHPGRGATTVAALLLLVVFSIGTVARNRIWSSPLTLWEDAALNQGTGRAHMNYGLALEAEGRSQEAFRQFQKAVELNPK